MHWRTTNCSTNHPWS